MELSDSKPAESFRDLRVWQEAYSLAITVYEVCQTFPAYEQYGLASQMRRSSVSVCSNIAEGFGRRTKKEKSRFYDMSNGSLTELENQLLIAGGVEYIKEEALADINVQCEKVHKMLSALQKTNRNQENGHK